MDISVIIPLFNEAESLPELGRVVDCFGTVLIRSRTVDSGSVTVSGGNIQDQLFIRRRMDGGSVHIGLLPSV